MPAQPLELKFLGHGFFSTSEEIGMFVLVSVFLFSQFVVTEIIAFNKKI